MPRIEIEFECDICVGIRLAPCAVFFCFFFFFFCVCVCLSVCTRIYIQHIARPFESDRSINIVFVSPSIRPSDQSVRCMKKAWVFSYSLNAQQRLIRLGGFPG